MEHDREASTVSKNHPFQPRSITKDKWIHHTSFLWDYDADHMAYLKLPQKRPEYRSDRDHDAFLSKLANSVADDANLDTSVAVNSLADSLAAALAPDFDVAPAPLEAALEAEARRPSGWEGGWKPVDFPPSTGSSA